MQPLDLMKSRESDPPQGDGERPSAEIIRLDEWRRRHRRSGLRWPRVRSVTLHQPLLRSDAPLSQRRVPIEASLMALIVFSAVAGAIFALMGLGYLP